MIEDRGFNSGQDRMNPSSVSGGLGLVVGVTGRYDERSSVFPLHSILLVDDLRMQGGIMPARI